MSAFSNFSIIQNALPVDGVPATGNFEPVLNIIPNTFNSPTGNSDSPYNTIYIGDSSNNIVGSETTPYLPVALPAYIPTLYENMYYVQTNLKNIISTTDTPDNREYPTSYAVKRYVASQLQGSEYLVPNVEFEEFISTGLTTSFLASSNLTQSPNVETFTDTTTNVTTFVTTFNMNTIDSARSGAEKVCINTTPLGLVGETQNNVLQIVLNKASQAFIVNGKSYSCYVFSNLGDTLNMFQFINPNTGDELFFVINYGGLFSTTPYYQSPSP